MLTWLQAEKRFGGKFGELVKVEANFNSFNIAFNRVQQKPAREMTPFSLKWCILFHVIPAMNVQKLKVVDTGMDGQSWGREAGGSVFGSCNQ